MNTYALLLEIEMELDVEKLIDEHLCGQRMDHVFAPVVDTFLFRSSLAFDEIHARLPLVVPIGSDGEESPWVLLQITAGVFSGSFPPGKSSRLKKLFPL